VIAGVASGVAERFSLSVALVRAGFLVCAILFAVGTLRGSGSPYGPSTGSDVSVSSLTLIGTIGVFAYALIWFVVPRDDQSLSPARRFASQIPGVPAWLGVFLFVVGASILGTQIGLWRAEAIWAFRVHNRGRTALSQRRRAPNERR
jgi:phage shock protein PspC (stress-responsive transcriptional regulator)